MFKKKWKQQMEEVNDILDFLLKEKEKNVKESEESLNKSEE